jgi:hypothetical protein
MADGRLQVQRAMIVAQAALVWADGDLDREAFIESGVMGEKKSAVQPYDPQVRRLVVEQLERMRHG